MKSVGYKVALCERDVAIYLAISNFWNYLWLDRPSYKIPALGFMASHWYCANWLGWFFATLQPIQLDMARCRFCRTVKARHICAPHRCALWFGHRLVCLSQYRRVDERNAPVLHQEICSQTGFSSNAISRTKRTCVITVSIFFPTLSCRRLYTSRRRKPGSLAFAKFRRIGGG